MSTLADLRSVWPEGLVERGREGRREGGTGKTNLWED
jgi:hypothetical protein